MPRAKTDSISERIRSGRSKSGLSQQELAEKMGVSQALVSLWERGKQPDAEQVERLEAVLGGITEDEPATEQSLPPVAIWLGRTLSKRNLTVNELAKKSGVSAPTIYNLLSGGAQNPQQRTLTKLESAVGEKFERTAEERESYEVSGIGELVDFNPHDPSDQPMKPGVYVFYDISGRPIYVGKATNIRDRVDDHKEKFWFKQPIVQTAAYIEIRDKQLRDQVETVLIQFLKNNAVINKNKTARD
jgi:transcriptional regulator with XRE-family HTH domain